MNREFFVWAHTPRLPSKVDIAQELEAAGFSCRLLDHLGDGQDPRSWRSLQFDLEGEGGPQSCVIHVSIPTSEDIQEMVEQYENLPVSAKHAARKYVIRAECDEYGEATMFQLRVVATVAQLTRGVVEDPEESGLMLVDEFETFIAST